MAIAVVAVFFRSTDAAKLTIPSATEASGCIEPVPSSYVACGCCCRPRQHLTTPIRLHCCLLSSGVKLSPSPRRSLGMSVVMLYARHHHLPGCVPLSCSCKLLRASFYDSDCWLVGRERRGTDSWSLQYKCQEMFSFRSFGVSRWILYRVSRGEFRH